MHAYQMLPTVVESQNYISPQVKYYWCFFKIIIYNQGSPRATWLSPQWSEGKSGDFRKLAFILMFSFPTTTCSPYISQNLLQHNNVKKDAINKLE